MINTRILSLCSCWLFIFIQNLHSTIIQTQLMSFCNQTLQISSSLSMIFTPSSYSSCCNVTLVRASSNLSEYILINVNQMFSNHSSLKIFDNHMQSVELIKYSSLNRTLMKTDVIHLPVLLNLCQFNLPPFEILITNLSKGPCLANHYRCSTSNSNQWCINEIFHCDGYHSCPQGIDEFNCPKTQIRLIVPKMTRTIRGGVVTSIIIIGLLLIISSVSIAVTFVYFQRKRQRRRRQFTYSLESTSDDWEPSGTGYHLFDNWTTHRRSPIHHPNNVIVDANEHLPITTMISNR